MIYLGIYRYIKSRKLYQGKGKNFLYKFDVDSPTQNHYRNRFTSPGTKGVMHADELSYIWKNTQGGVPPKDSFEFRAIEKFVIIKKNKFFNNFHLIFILDVNFN